MSGIGGITLVDISRREWELVKQRISTLEMKVRFLEETAKAHEMRLKPQNLHLTIKQQKKQEELETGEKPES